MSRRFPSTVLLLLCVFGSTSCTRAAWRGMQNTTMVGRQAPALAPGRWVYPEDTRPVSVAADARRLYVFFDARSSVCEGEVPAIQDLCERFRHKQIFIIGITADAESVAWRFVLRAKTDYPVLAVSARTLDLYDIDSVWGSEIYLIEPDGMIVARGLLDIERFLADG